MSQPPCHTPAYPSHYFPVPHKRNSVSHARLLFHQGAEHFPFTIPTLSCRETEAGHGLFGAANQGCPVHWYHLSSDGLRQIGACWDVCTSPSFPCCTVSALQALHPSEPRYLNACGYVSLGMFLYQKNKPGEFFILPVYLNVYMQPQSHSLLMYLETSAMLLLYLPWQGISNYLPKK